jgi:protocatechuate 3,4-dioxygenase beta subunit
MTDDHRTLRRRDALGLLGLGAGAAWQLTRSGHAIARLASVRAESAASCVLSPEVTEGPYWIANHLTRRNITEGQHGLPLILKIAVQDAGTCKRIPGADVEIWHANALGAYSGFSSGNTSKRFLRGHQKADANGRVIFDTIYPGWYPGRTPHIHVKVHVGGNVVHTGQIFFSDALSDAVYRTSKYASHGEPDTTNAADSIYAQAGGSRARAHVKRRSGGKKGYVGTITLGVRR